MLTQSAVIKNGHNQELTFEPEINKTKAARRVVGANNKTLSVIIRCHKRERLPFLEEAIFSLAIQEWSELEIVVVIQNGTDEFIRDVRQVIDYQPWQKLPLIQIHAVEFKPGFDGRSSLLNHGIVNSTGRFLAFLDDDDVVYQHGYQTLIEQLLQGDGSAAVAAGGCRVARAAQKSDHWFISAKETPFTGGRNRYDLYRDNFMPIHSYVIDRLAVSAADLYFDDELPPLEDYEFLLRLSSKYEFDFAKLDVFVCEYRIHNANSIPYTADATEPQIAKYQRAFQLIEERKKNLLCLVPLRDLIKAPQPQQTAIIEELITPKYENPKIVQKVLLSTGDVVYNFFKSYPRLEKRLSKMVRRGWNYYHKNRDAE